MRIDRIVIIPKNEGGIIKGGTREGRTVPAGAYVQVALQRLDPIGTAMALIPIHAVDPKDIDAMIERQGE